MPLAIAALCLTAFATPTMAREVECFAIVGPDPHHVTYQFLPDYTVERASPPMRLPEVEGTLRAITCARDSLYLSPNDIHVLTILNLPLMVGTMTDGDERLLTFELTGGEFRIKVYDGHFTAEEQRQTEMAIESMGFRMSIEQDLRDD
jgi:hypothetical protein